MSSKQTKTLNDTKVKRSEQKKEAEMLQLPFPLKVKMKNFSSFQQLVELV